MFANKNLLKSFSFSLIKQNSPFLQNNLKNFFTMNYLTASNSFSHCYPDLYHRIHIEQPINSNINEQPLVVQEKVEMKNKTNKIVKRKRDKRKYKTKQTLRYR